MITSTANLLKKGYILFPKVLFEEQIKETKRAGGYFDAFILVLTHVNYSTTTCCIKDHTFDCLKGESIISLNHWAQIFGWTRSRTRYFFLKMFENGIIEKLATPYTTHIRITDYDMLIGRSRHNVSRAEADGITFEAFWEKYYETTQKPKTNIGRARREWKKLSAHERSLSLSRIDDYYDHLTNTKFCMQPAAYLSDKAFLNEYDD